MVKKKMSSKLNKTYFFQLGMVEYEVNRTFLKKEFSEGLIWTVWARKPRFPKIFCGEYFQKGSTQ